MLLTNDSFLVFVLGQRATWLIVRTPLGLDLNLRHPQKFIFSMNERPPYTCYLPLLNSPDVVRSWKKHAQIVWGFQSTQRDSNKTWISEKILHWWSSCFLKTNIEGEMTMGAGNLFSISQRVEGGLVLVAFYRCVPRTRVRVSQGKTPMVSGRFYHWEWDQLGDACIHVRKNLSWPSLSPYGKWWRIFICHLVLAK